MKGIQDPNQRLKTAVRSEPVPPFLDKRILAAIRAPGPAGLRVPRFAPVAAMAVMVIAGAGSYQLGRLKATLESRTSYISSVSNSVATLMQAGLRDHIHCSVFRKYPRRTPAVQEFVAEMGSKYAPLIPILRQQIPGEYRLVIAHECRYEGRRFIHLSLMNDTHLMSLAITLKRDGESFGAGRLLPVLTQSGIPMYEAGAQRFRISAFETRDHLAYFVSDLPQEKNTELMLAIAPQVKTFLSRQEL